MLTATLLVMSLAADGRPLQSPRPPQFPPPGVVLVAASAPPACGLSGCTCGCRSGEVCRCAVPAAVAVPAPPVFYPQPVYRPAFQPAYRPAYFGGFSGGGGC